jgi:hypothetical protein
VKRELENQKRELLKKPLKTGKLKDNKNILEGINMIKKIASAIWAVVKDLIAEMWTLLGMFIAWVTLDGSAKSVVGMATLVALTVWIISLPLRMEKHED